MISTSPEETFEIGHRIGSRLAGGELLLLSGGLGAGKTLITKGIVEALGFDADDVNSPSFTLVNLYRTDAYDVYHIDLWRLEDVPDPAAAVGLEEMLEDRGAVIIVEWAERLTKAPARSGTIRILIEGDGDDPRRITIS
jgi:tRNA threonylcarbamoyladenosine biosynthesis protein TsaE